MKEIDFKVSEIAISQIKKPKLGTYEAIKKSFEYSSFLLFSAKIENRSEISSFQKSYEPKTEITLDFS